MKRILGVLAILAALAVFATPAEAQFKIYGSYWNTSDVDDTFGPAVVFSKHAGGRANVPPTEGGLYFGHVKIDAATRGMTVTHYDLAGSVLHRLELPPQR